MYKLIQEGKARIYVPSASKISRRMGVFYNPVMKLNRDLSVLLLNAIERNNLQIADPLAGTGIRSIRFLLELKKNKVRSISINDSSKAAVGLIKRNLKLNGIGSKKINLHNEDANLFLLKSRGFDYIDIDPFGFPGSFLPAAVERLARNGILAVTATDTAALAGSVPSACIRKYWARPLRNEMMHETGLRILIRKVQLVAAEREKALTPVFSYSKEHYMRAFFLCEKGRRKADSILRQHGILFYDKEYAGPMWLGGLWNRKIVGKMVKHSKDEEVKKFVNKIRNEAAVDAVGFYDIHKICKGYKLSIPKKESIIKRIKSKGYKAAETHFSSQGIRSDITLDKLIKLMKK